MDNTRKAYLLGRKLALLKFAEEVSRDANDLTKLLKMELNDNNEKKERQLIGDILDTNERSGSASWGDKIDIESEANSGIQV